MSEFKFLCPVCGQHIATDSSASGTQIECPTCFQKMVVPQAPMTQSKYILSATQYIKPPAVSPPAPTTGPKVSTRRRFVPEILVLLLFICMVAVAIFFHQRATRSRQPGQGSIDATHSAEFEEISPAWSLDVAAASFPEATVAGRILGRKFLCERAVLQNGSLMLRQQASGRRADIAVIVYLFVNGSRELGGQVFNVGTNDLTPNPYILLRCKEANTHVTERFTNGYAMKLEFGKIGGSNVPGRIFLCLPDGARSFVAGTFDAEMRKPSLPKQH